MKYIVYIIILFIILILLSVYNSKKGKKEGFTVWDLDYGTGIGPWWAQGAGLNRGYHRCICSGSGNCRCINDKQFENTNQYPQYYFN
jgi:hypothetical protein